MSLTANMSEDVVQVVSKKIKRSLENWREVVLLLYDILLWHEVPLHPALIFITSSFIFLIICLVNPTVVSVVPFLLLGVILCDFIGPLLSRIFSEDSWNGSKEKQYERVCSTIASYYVYVTMQLNKFYGTKESKPVMYYSWSLSFLVTLIWIGSVIDTVFLTYGLVTFALLLPGLKRHGFLKAGMKQLKCCFVKAVNILTSDNRKMR